MDTLEQVLAALMRRYATRVPDVSKITQALIARQVIEKQTDIENDHIAFRNIGVPQLGIASFEKIFLHYGYEPRDNFHFEQKKLKARWYAPPAPRFPRIFISELMVEELPVPIQQIIHSYTAEVPSDPVDQLDLDDAQQVDNFLHSPLWRTPTWQDYKTLLEVSEYAAWVIYNRYYLNHYTISVHNLPPGYNTLAAFNQFLEDTGIVLNDAGGKIKQSADTLLLQSSTVSEQKSAVFADGETYEIAGSFVEFAERRVLPEYKHLDLKNIQRHHRRDGFETANADKIFESTYTEQTERKAS